MGLPNAYRTRHPALGNQLLSGFFVLSFSFSPSPSRRLPSPSRSLAFRAHEIVSIAGHLLAPCSRAFLLLVGTAFFFWLRLRWVAPRPVYARPMRSATVVTPLPECSDSGGLPHRLLIGAVPLTPSRPLTGRSLLLAVLPHRSATRLSFSLRKPRLCFNSRASFLLPYLDIFH